MKNKNHMTVSTDSENALDKIQHLSWWRLLSTLGIQGTYLNIIKAIYDKPAANIIFNSENLKVFSLRSGTRHKYLFSSLLLDIILEILARVFGQEKQRRTFKWERKK